MSPGTESRQEETIASATASRCENCRAEVSGHYCSHCGQRLEHSVHSIRHFLMELAEDLTHADSRLWRTMLALLFKPGFLTREFLDGRRVRYLPPVRLYLVLSVLFFVVMGVAPHEPARIVIAGPTRDVNGKVRAPTPEEVQDVARLRPGETPQQRAQRICRPENMAGIQRAWLRDLSLSLCRKTLADDSHGLRESLLHNTPRALFVFLPVLAPIMVPLYRHPRRYYVEHLLFFVHVHAFLFVLIGLYLAVAALNPPTWIDATLTIAVDLYVPVYLFTAMRSVYGQSRARTFGKFSVLLLSYFIVGLIMFMLTMLYSMYTL